MKQGTLSWGPLFFRVRRPRGIMLRPSAGKKTVAPDKSSLRKGADHALSSPGSAVFGFPKAPPPCQRKGLVGFPDRNSLFSACFPAFWRAVEAFSKPVVLLDAPGGVFFVGDQIPRLTVQQFANAGQVLKIDSFPFPQRLDNSL